ncbi:hypothetical protein [Vibrio sp. D431a]|uniref:hypothetical protein n=1 Tax=Vibrio sp. D431a TaxID=2837388 RepID=UPI0025552E33|nr:hypothetical protein [Vibrio sp. D431a]MDK9793224.1 hypothetical protein [Vibrio sp. D431a]
MRLHVGKKTNRTSTEKHDKHVQDWQLHNERNTPIKLSHFLTDEEENEYKRGVKYNILPDNSSEHELCEKDDLGENDLEQTPAQNFNDKDSLEADSISLMHDKAASSESNKNFSDNQSKSRLPTNPQPRKHKLNLFTKLLVAYSVGVSSFCGYEVLFGKDARLEGRLANVQDMFSDLNKDYSVVTDKLNEQAKVGELLSTRIDEVATTSLSDFESLNTRLTETSASVNTATEVANKSKTKVESQNAKIQEVTSVAAAASLTSTNSMEIAKTNKQTLESFIDDITDLKANADIIINRRDEAATSYKDYTTHINGVVADLSRSIKGISPRSIERIVESTVNRKMENRAFSAKYQVNKDELAANQELSNNELVEIRSNLEKYQQELELKLTQHGSKLKVEVKEDVSSLMNQIRNEMSKESALTSKTRNEQADAIAKLFKQVDLQKTENLALTNDIAKVVTLAQNLEDDNARLVKAHNEIQDLLKQISSDNIALHQSHQELSRFTNDAISNLQEREKTIIKSLKQIASMIETK